MPERKAKELSALIRCHTSSHEHSHHQRASFNLAEVRVTASDDLTKDNCVDCDEHQYETAAAMASTSDVFVCVAASPVPSSSPSMANVCCGVANRSQCNDNASGDPMGRCSADKGNQ